MFLHAGTRTGARALGLDTSRQAISPDELPKAFRKLNPREIEDVLCIYKDQLAGAALIDRERRRCQVNLTRSVTPKSMIIDLAVHHYQAGILNNRPCWFSSWSRNTISPGSNTASFAERAGKSESIRVITGWMPRSA